MVVTEPSIGKPNRIKLAIVTLPSLSHVTLLVERVDGDYLIWSLDTFANGAETSPRVEIALERARTFSAPPWYVYSESDGDYGYAAVRAAAKELGATVEFLPK